MAISNQRTFKPTVALIVAGCLLGSSIGAANAAENHQSEHFLTTSSATLLQNEAQTEQLLRVIDQIPEEVLLAGDQATQRWVSVNLLHNAATPGKATTYKSFLGCSGAILATIGTTVIPAAKLLKIKRYMKALGGTTQAIKLLWGASFSYEKLQALGGAAAALGAELLGITAIRQACA